MIAYLSFDGILGALGWSQVARVVIGLAERGFRYHLVSLEQPDRLAEPERVAAARGALDRAGVAWTPLPYRAGGAGMAPNLLRLTAAAARIVPRGGLVHARGYHGALCARQLRPLGVRYVFDARGYWIDERLDAGRLFTRPVVLAAARHVERALYRDASAVVTLTALHADDLRGGAFGPLRGPLVTIPTCADFDAFRPREEHPEGPPDPCLGGGCVLGLVGSINASYRVDEAIALAARVLALRADARLVVLSEQREEFARRCAAAGVPEQRLHVATVPHAQVPAWIPWIDWGIQLLTTRPSKRASMPTKLAEFLAAGVRPVHHGCNAEVGEWVARTGAGLVLDDLEPATLERAAHAIADSGRDPQALQEARRRAASHFSLSAGLARYAELLGALT